MFCVIIQFMIKIIPLFSGSRGNSTLVRTSTQNILLDLGYGFRTMVAKLNSIGLDPRDISAILITHEHRDHICALKPWEKHFHTPVYAPVLAANFICQKSCCNVTPVCGDFEFDDARVSVFRCTHDAIQCFGYRFYDGKVYAALVTDTGETTAKLVKFLAPCEKILLESNHDVDTLNRGAYPYLLKQRILSKFGHLSNVQAAKTLSQLDNVRAVVLGHLSQQNNTKELAFKAAATVFENKKLVVNKDIALYVADQYQNNFEI